MESERKKIVAILAAEGFFALVAIPLVRTFVGNDVYRWINSQNWYSPTVGWLALMIIIALNICIIADHAWARTSAGVAAVCLALVGCYFIQHPPLKLKGGVGQWLHDDYVGISVPKGVSGTLLGEEGYDLEFDLENRTSMPMQVTKIEVEKYNTKAADAFGGHNGLVHTSTYNVVKFLKANEQTTYSIPGNEILPLTAIVRIYHSLSGQPSTFEVDLGSKMLPMPAPRKLPQEAIRLGRDGMSPILEATKAASHWGGNVTLLAAFPADNERLIDLSSRLKYVDVKAWIVTFYSPQLNQIYTAIVRESGVEGHEAPRSDSDFALPDGPVGLPQIGNQRALEIANAGNMLSADWKDGPRLQSIKIGASWRAVWILPYLGTSGLPVVVDADSGELLEMHGSGFIAQASATSESPRETTPDSDTSQDTGNQDPVSGTDAAILTTWIAADQNFGPNGSSRNFHCTLFIIGNPPGGKALQFDAIKISFLHDTPAPDDVTSSLIYVDHDDSSPELGPGLKKITLNFFAGKPVSMPADANPETLTVEPDRQIELHHVTLFTDSGRVKFTLLNHNQAILVSPVVELPDWSNVPSVAELFSMGEEKTPGQRGTEIHVQLLPENSQNP